MPGSLRKNLEGSFAPAHVDRPPLGVTTVELRLVGRRRRDEELA